MPSNSNKPLGRSLGEGCGILNVPVVSANDQNGVDVELPVPVGATRILAVWPSAYRFHAIPVGDSCTITILKNGVQQGGSIGVPDGVHLVLEIGGMNDRQGLYPNQIRVVSGASAETSIWWDCENPGGA